MDIPGPDIFLAMAVLRLGVLPSFLIKNSITASVTVLNPLMKHPHKLTKNAPIGAIVDKYNRYKKIFTNETMRLITKLSNGTPLTKKP